MSRVTVWRWVQQAVLRAKAGVQLPQARKCWGPHAALRRLDREAQNQSDQWMRSMVSSLQHCAPHLRRKVLKLLKELDELETLRPLDQDNPVRASLDENAKAP